MTWFASSLEELEATRARQILDLWESKNWSTDRLRELTDRQIMVVDDTVEIGPGEGVIDFVELERAFEEGAESVVSFISRTTKTFRFPS